MSFARRVVLLLSLSVAIFLIALWIPRNGVAVGAHGATFLVEDVGLFGGLNRVTLIADDRGRFGEIEKPKHTRNGWDADLERAVWRARQSRNPDAEETRRTEKYFADRIKTADSAPLNKDFAPDWFLIASSFARFLADVLLSALIVTIAAFVGFPFNARKVARGKQ